MVKEKMTAEQERWRAEDDARTLAYAQEIAEDKSRLTKAKRAAQKMASDTAKRAQAMLKVSKTPPAKKNKVVKKKAAPKRAAAKRNPRKR